MSESADYEPAPHWGGHDFTSARNMYDDHVRTSYAKAVNEGVKTKDVVPESIESDSENPIVICCDVTGSMGTWPKTIFSKLPYLEHEAKEYFGDDVAISFSAVGDAFDSVEYPFQARPFVKGVDLKDSLEKLVIRGGGGGTCEESYDLAALYYSKKCKLPNVAGKPLFIFIADEGWYSFVDENKAKSLLDIEFTARDKAKAKALDESSHSDRVTPKQVIDDLKHIFNVYVVRKPYGNTSDEGGTRDSVIRKEWEDFLGADHVLSLPDPERVVDVIFGIFAKETNKGEYFEKELKDRQLKDVGGQRKVDVVLKSLRSIHNLPAPTRKKLTGPDKNGKSISLADDDNKSVGRKKSISLLDD